MHVQFGVLDHINTQCVRLFSQIIVLKLAPHVVEYPLIWIASGINSSKTNRRRNAVSSKGDRTIGSIHGTNNMEIWRNAESIS